MSSPLSLDLRNRFRKCIESCMSGREAGRQLMISPATASRLARKVRSGESLAPAQTGRPVGTGKLAPYHNFLKELVEQDGDITLIELSDALFMAQGMRVHHTSISKALRRLGFTYKKNAAGSRARQAPCSQRASRVS
ncbi:hypothetical protein [Polycladidibacter stylochi]|uniref:hypothetical protein n=1 Tax=Polycladidibacter stylochi TaxID=1807766 RepID=UPI00082E716C|nr:hypothetical protein [Pseudovibrio stylochi]